MNPTGRATVGTFALVVVRPAGKFAANERGGFIWADQRIRLMHRARRL